MGETYFWDEFISPETGKVFGNIQFEKKWDSLILEKAKSADNLNLIEIAVKSRGVTEFDIKIQKLE